MQIYAYNSSGFGNAVFSYLAAILFTVLFDAEIISIENKDDIKCHCSNFRRIEDAEFIQIVEAKINENKTLIDCSQNYYLPGYYQHDNYYIKYKKEIIEYIERHGDYKIFSSHTKEPFCLKNVIQYVETPVYDLAIHLRLGDYIELGWTVNPLYMRDLWNKIALPNDKTVCIVVQPSNSVTADQYVRFMQDLIPHAVLEMNDDPMRDYNILRNAKKLVCSCSTLSWIASMFSNDPNQFIYFPNYKSRWNHEQFRKPHDRIKYYDIKRSYQTELWEILKNVRKTIKTNNIRILFLNMDNANHKNKFGLQNYKNIAVHTVYSIEELFSIDVLWYDVIYSPACPIDVKKYPHIKFWFGPYFSNLNQMDQIRGENAIYLQLSTLAIHEFKNRNDFCKDIRFEILPCNIDTDQFTPGENHRDKVFIYYNSSNCNPIYLEFIKTELQHRNVSYQIFGDIEEEYLQYLKESKYGIWIKDTHESEYLEALSCDVPLLVWNIQYIGEEYRFDMNVWDDQCGEYFYFKDQFHTAYDEFIENIRLEKYTPRKYVLNNVSMELYEKKLINIIHSM